MSATHPVTTECRASVDHEGSRWHAFATERNVLVHREDLTTRRELSLAVPYAAASPTEAAVFLPSAAVLAALGMPTAVLVRLNVALREVLR
jgi:hypothetical protein